MSGYHRLVSTEITDESVLQPKARAFVSARPPRHATLATTNRDGSPHQIVIWFRLLSEESGDRFLVNSRRGRRWPSNLERDGRASLAIYEGDDAVTVECVVDELYDDERARDDIAEMALRYYAADEAQASIAAFRTQPRVTFLLRPTRIHIHGDPH